MDKCRCSEEIEISRMSWCNCWTEVHWWQWSVKCKLGKRRTEFKIRGWRHRRTTRRGWALTRRTPSPNTRGNKDLSTDMRSACPNSKVRIKGVYVIILSGLLSDRAPLLIGVVGPCSLRHMVGGAATIFICLQDFLIPFFFCNLKKKFVFTIFKKWILWICFVGFEWEKLILFPCLMCEFFFFWFFELTKFAKES